MGVRLTRGRLVLSPDRPGLNTRSPQAEGNGSSTASMHPAMDFGIFSSSKLRAPHTREERMPFRFYHPLPALTFLRSPRNVNA